MSDYIDEVELYALVESHFPTSNAAGQRADEYSLAMNRTATKLARAVAERVREAERAKRVECERALASVSRAMYVYGFKPGSDGVWRPDPPYWNPPLVPPTGEPNGDLYRAKMEIARLTEELHRVLVKLEEANKTD